MGLEKFCYYWLYDLKIIKTNYHKWLKHPLCSVQNLLAVEVYDVSIYLYRTWIMAIPCWHVMQAANVSPTLNINRILVPCLFTRWWCNFTSCHWLWIIKTSNLGKLATENMYHINLWIIAFHLLLISLFSVTSLHAIRSLNLSVTHTAMIS